MMMGGGGFGGGGMMRGGGPSSGGSGGRWGSMGLDRDAEGGAIYDHSVVLRLMKYVTPYRSQLALTIMAMLFYTGTVVSLPLLVGWIIDSYIATGDLNGLNLVALIFALVATVQFFMNVIHQRLMAYIGQKVLYTLRVELFGHLQRLSMSFFDRHQVGSVMSRVQNDVQQLQEFLNVAVMTLADVLSIGGIVVTMAVLSPKLAAITLSVVPLLFILMIVWQRFARKTFIQVRQAIAEVNSGLQENITGVRVVQSLNREDTNMRRFGKANYDHLDANLKAGRLMAMLFPSVEILSALALSLVVFFGGSMVLDNQLEVGVLVAFALYIQRFFEPVRNLTMQYSSLQRAMVSGSRIFELLDTEPEVVDQPDAIELDKIEGAVRYEGVKFHYIEEEPVLKGIDMEIPAGKTYALVGPTGAGKTTIVSLLMRLYDVSEGRITVDGHDVRDVTQTSLAHQLSVVPQEPYLFSGTVNDNIRYNRIESTAEDIERAARAVGAHDFIMKLDKGYDTPMQERGGNLSVGQRQLISFARALVADPRILILDEATANIDTHTEMLIQEALSELLNDRTALVIAHRLSTIRNADQIIVVDQGAVVEQGTHDELIALDGLYAKLYSFSTGGVMGEPRRGAETPDGEAAAGRMGPGNGRRGGRPNGRGSGRPPGGRGGMGMRPEGVPGGDS